MYSLTGMAKTTIYQSVLTRRSLYNLLLLFVLLVYLTCNTQGSFISKMFVLVAKGSRLDNNVMKEIETYSEIECSHLCLSDYPLCKSINYKIKRELCSSSRHKCQLNSATKSLQPENFVKDDEFKYFEIVKESVDETHPVKENSLPVGKSCSDLYKKGQRKDGTIYKIDPDGLGGFDVRCDMTTSGGGWTVFQRRIDGSVDFFRGWNEYKKGFGELNGEFWLGLDNIHRLSKSGQNVLRVDLGDFENETRYANYLTFAVANEVDKYKLTVGGYSGDAGDALIGHNGMKFSTKDADNDQLDDLHCAVTYKGAWWYYKCFTSHLNAQYLRGDHIAYAAGVNWRDWKGYNYSLKKTEMKIRPGSF